MEFYFAYLISISCQKVEYWSLECCKIKLSENVLNVNFNSIPLNLLKDYYNKFELANGNEKGFVWII